MTPTGAPWRPVHRGARAPGLPRWSVLDRARSAGRGVRAARGRRSLTARRPAVGAASAIGRRSVVAQRGAPRVVVAAVEVGSQPQRPERDRHLQDPRDRDVGALEQPQPCLQRPGSVNGTSSVATTISAAEAAVGRDAGRHAGSRPKTPLTRPSENGHRDRVDEEGGEMEPADERLRSAGGIGREQRERQSDGRLHGEHDADDGPIPGRGTDDRPAPTAQASVSGARSRTPAPAANRAARAPSS